MQHVLRSRSRSAQRSSAIPEPGLRAYIFPFQRSGRRPTMAMVQVRYIVDDVDAAIPFYEQLGFELVMHPAPPFAMLSRGALRLALSAPNPMGGGGQPMPDGTQQRPGGWNRFAIEVDDLDATVAR